MKILPEGAELFHVNRRTDEGQTHATKLTVGFRNFANAPKNESYSELYLKIQLAPPSKHTPSILYKTDQLILCREIIAIYSESHVKHTNARRGQNVELFNVKSACKLSTGL